MTRRIAVVAMMLAALSPCAQANDYSLITNAVLKGWLPWRISALLIETCIGDSEERTRAVASLVQYKSRGLVPHLKAYAKDPSGSIRMATFWPLYKNGEHEFAFDLVRQEVKTTGHGATSVFFIPNIPGSEYKIELSRSDPDFRKLVEEIATDKKVQPMVRMYAAIHLSQIGDEGVAVAVAKEILDATPPDPKSPQYNDWPKDSQENFHVRKFAKWCMKLCAR